MAEIVLLENNTSLDQTIPEDIEVNVESQSKKEILDEGLPKTPNRNGPGSNDSMNSQQALKSSPSKQLLSIQTQPLVKKEESPRTLKDEQDLNECDTQEGKQNTPNAAQDKAQRIDSSQKPQHARQVSRDT